MNKRLFLLNTLAATLFLSGCMGYQLNSSRPAGVDSVSMKPVINRTSESAIEIEITHAMRDRILLDGRMKLINEPTNADATIEIKLTKYELNPIAFQDNLKTTPDLYRMKISGVAELRNTKSGTVISTSKNYGESTFEFENDLTSSKRDALSDAADEIARLMLDDLIETWQ